MKIRFNVPQNGPDRLVSEVELIFDEGPLEGMKLVGLSVWKGSDDGDLYVTMPAREFGSGICRRYYDFLRTAESRNGAALQRVKLWILSEFRAQPGYGDLYVDRGEIS